MDVGTIYRSRAPVRISFAGGGTDVSPYLEEHGGFVVSTTITSYAWSSVEFSLEAGHVLGDTYNRVREYALDEKLVYDGKLDVLKAVLNHFKPDLGVRMYMRNDVPHRSGLGSSAAAFVSLIGLFNKVDFRPQLTEYEVAELAFRLERDELRNLGGRQDQYASVFGGLNYIEFKPTGQVIVNPIKMLRATELEFEKHLILAYIMDREVSGDIIGDQTQNYEKGNKKTRTGLDETKQIAQQMNQALRCGDLTRFGELLHQSWEAKKKFSKMITNKKIDSIYEKARKAGALGGKISGAGGGGHMVFFCDSGCEE
ncbi:MAG: GHMP kinase, partial [Candidatus Altiarchaeales archaeon]|nr:GHMP kinase [Candidatus Altiarchaeales archaeon]